MYSISSVYSCRNNGDMYGIVYNETLSEYKSDFLEILYNACIQLWSRQTGSNIKGKSIKYILINFCNYFCSFCNYFCIITI